MGAAGSVFHFVLGNDVLLCLLKAIPGVLTRAGYMDDTQWGNESIFALAQSQAFLQLFCSASGMAITPHECLKIVSGPRKGQGVASQWDLVAEPDTTQLEDQALARGAAPPDPPQAATVGHQSGWEGQQGHKAACLSGGGLPSLPS